MIKNPSLPNDLLPQQQHLPLHLLNPAIWQPYL
jgi:hypothetical protein